MVDTEADYDAASHGGAMTRRRIGTSTRWARRWVPGLVLAAFLAEVVSLAARPLDDPDTWWHLRLGNDLIDQRSLSAPDRWSTFGTVPWTPTEPLPEMIAAQAERWFGLPGVAWLFGLAIALLVMALFFSMRAWCDTLPAVLATILGTIGCGLSISPRPQLLSFAILPVVIAAWRASENDLRPRWWLVPLTWVWSMTHGFWFLGVVYGALLAAAVIVERRPSRTASLTLVAVPLLSLLSVLINPAGLGVFEAPFRVHALAPGIYEWQRTSLTGVAALVVIAMIIACMGLWVVARSRPPWTSLALLATSAFFCWYAERTVAVAAVVAAPVLARTLQSVLGSVPGISERESPRRGEVALFLAWSAVCLAVLGLAVPQTSPDPGGDVPVHLDAQLDRLSPGSVVLNTYSVGGWLHWRHPDLDPMVDGLATPYAPGYIVDFQHAMYGHTGWRQFVERSHPDAALVHLGVPMVANLESLGWTQVATDRSYTLLLPPP